MILDNSNEKNAEMLMKVAEPAIRIFDDENMTKALDDVRNLMGKGPVVQALGIMRLIPVFLKDHKTDLYEIIAGLTDKTVAEVAQMPTRETISVLQTLLRDEDIVSFFSSTEQPESKAEAK